MSERLHTQWAREGPGQIRRAGGVVWGVWDPRWLPDPTGDRRADGPKSWWTHLGLAGLGYVAAQHDPVVGAWAEDLVLETTLSPLVLTGFGLQVRQPALNAIAAAHPATPAWVLERLTRAALQPIGQPHLRRTARGGLMALRDLSTQQPSRSWVLQALLDNPRLPRPCLEQMSQREWTTTGAMARWMAHPQGDAERRAALWTWLELGLTPDHKPGKPWENPLGHRWRAAAEVLLRHPHVAADQIEALLGWIGEAPDWALGPDLEEEVDLPTLIAYGLTHPAATPRVWDAGQKLLAQRREPDLWLGVAMRLTRLRRDVLAVDLRWLELGLETAPWGPAFQRAPTDVYLTTRRPWRRAMRRVLRAVLALPRSRERDQAIITLVRVMPQEVREALETEAGADGAARLSDRHAARRGLLSPSAVVREVTLAIVGRSINTPGSESSSPSAP